MLKRWGQHAVGVDISSLSYDIPLEATQVCEAFFGKGAFPDLVSLWQAPVPQSPPGRAYLEFAALRAWLPVRLQCSHSYR